MKQIKTICEVKPENFDGKANALIRAGWSLTFRTALVIAEGVILYVGGFEKGVEKPSCETCRHEHKDVGEQPCACCDANLDKWEAKK